MRILQHLNIPSPITEVETTWTKKYGLSLYLKRDDLIHPLISGNKWRKLKGIFSHFGIENISSIQTYGGAYSNHLVATAVAASILKVPSIGMIRGEKPKVFNPVLKIGELYGMELHFLSREEYRQTNRTSGLNEGRLTIPEGGACELGTIGCEQILAEIDDLNSFSKIYVSCGTGTTITGLSNFLSKNQLPKDMLIGIQVLKGENYIANELADLYGISGVKILDEHHHGGYAKTNLDLISFIKSFTAETGILLDPIYTGKMMFAIKNLAEGGELSNKRVLAIHTGGLTGWFGKYSEL